MRHGEHHGHERPGPGPHGPHHRHHGPGHGHRHHGPQTFRRGRALEFLQRLDVKRATLVQQLAQPELQAIHQVVSGELKAVELIRNEFIELFDLYEREDGEGEIEVTQAPGEDVSDEARGESRE